MLYMKSCLTWAWPLILEGYSCSDDIQYLSWLKFVLDIRPSLEWRLMPLRSHKVYSRLKCDILLYLGMVISPAQATYLDIQGSHDTVTSCPTWAWPPIPPRGHISRPSNVIYNIPQPVHGSQSKFSPGVTYLDLQGSYMTSGLTWTLPPSRPSLKIKTCKKGHIWHPSLLGMATNKAIVTYLDLEGSYITSKQDLQVSFIINYSWHP